MEIHSEERPARTALVTGGGSGIGRATAFALATVGLDVLVTGRRPDPISETASTHANIRAFTADAASAADVDEAVRIAAERHGRIDVVVNNAGTMHPGGLDEFVRADAVEMWETNVLGPTLVARAALEHLRATWGVIVNVSSTFGAKPAPYIGQYGATKAALEQLTRSWALELAGDGIRVNAVAPGPTESDALAASGMSEATIEQVKATERERIPLGRRGSPDDIAAIVVALCDPSAAWVTGQVIGVDGGFALA
ncbi:SDR family NAD(P)-dependent oxidoreductase [Solicola gregarius]|uniref:SDR family oxidoreductase n=1 Tax=Solicola gregarius TaxID=2908642 RepID=A0AA46YIZ2_9ACTN|nr:SDR family oxidoreductase [Solicola gregarius]UYM03825.1 SDR family oxidoreductase [Solicola gregarius]